MAELVPGLQQAQPPAGPPQAGPQPAGLPPPPSGPPPVAPPNPVGEERTKEDPDWDKYAAEKARLRAIQADLLRQMEERSKPSPMEFWSSMARGFGDPNNKSFASGAAGFAGNLQASNEAQRGREMEMYKMRAEMAKQQLEDTGSDIVAKQLFNPAGGESFAPVAQAVGISSAQAQQLPPEVKKSMMLQWFSGDRKGAVDTFAKYTLENAKTPDEIKVAQQLSGMFPGVAPNTMMQFFARTKLLGDPVQIMTEIRNITKQMDAEELPRQAGNTMIAILQNRLNAGNPQQPATAAPATPAAPVAPAIKPPIPVSAAIPTAPATDANIIRNAFANTRSGQIPKGASLEDAANVLNQSIADPELRRVLLEDYKKGITTSPMSAVQPTIMKTADTGEGPNKRERELQQSEDIEKSKLIIARQSALENTWSDDNQRARDEIRDARTVHQTVSENKDGFGLLSKPGSALAYAAQAGFRIGDKSVGINELEQSLLRSGKYTQKEINAVSIVHQIALKWQLAVAAAQKGAASNYERTLFSQAGLNISDNPKIIQYKASLIEAQARNRQEVWNSYQQFKENNKRGNIDQFQATPEFIKLQKSFDQKLDKIRSAYSQ